MTLPQPGPGRPHHPNYTQPGSQTSLLEILVLILGIVVIAGLLEVL